MHLEKVPLTLSEVWERVGNPLPVCPLLVIESMVNAYAGGFAMTGWAHCQRQVAFFKCLNKSVHLP